MGQKKVNIRHNRILTELKKHGTIDLKTLAEKFGYHEMTIRRDLKRLEEMGLLIRTIGGACLVPSRFLGYSTKLDQDMNWEEKQDIVEYVSKNLIEDGDSLFLSSGVTVLQLLKQLHKDHNKLRIYTNSVDNISYEYANMKFELIILGGFLRPDSPCVYGDIALSDLDMIKGKVDKVFIEADAVVNEEEFKGFMVYNNFEASIFDKILSLVPPENRFVLADFTKFEKVGLFEVCSFDEVNAVITNKLKRDVFNRFKDVVNIIQVESSSRAKRHHSDEENPDEIESEIDADEEDDAEENLHEIKKSNSKISF